MPIFTKQRDFPLPYKELVVSQPVKACRLGRASHISDPNAAAIFPMSIARWTSFVPVSKKEWLAYQTSMKKCIVMLRQYRESRLTLLHDLMHALCVAACSMRVSASSWSVVNSSTSQTTRVCLSAKAILKQSLPDVTKRRMFVTTVVVFHSLAKNFKRVSSDL